MNAKVDIGAVVHTKYRYNAERWRPTDTHNDAFNWSTDLDHSSLLTPTIANSILTQVELSRARGGEVELHLSVRIDNVTHPTPGKGVIPLAKAQRSFGMSDIEVTGVVPIQTLIDNVIEELRATAEY